MEWPHWMTWESAVEIQNSTRVSNEEWNQVSNEEWNQVSNEEWNQVLNEDWNQVSNMEDWAEKLLEITGVERKMWEKILIYTTLFYFENRMESAGN